MKYLDIDGYNVNIDHRDINEDVNRGGDKAMMHSRLA